MCNIFCSLEQITEDEAQLLIPTYGNALWL